MGGSRDLFPQDRQALIWDQSANSLLLLFYFILESDASPTPPITVTHKPEEDTFGVSYFLVKRNTLKSRAIFGLHFRC